MQGSDVLLADLRAAVYLIDHELRVKEDPDALDFATAGELESFDEARYSATVLMAGPIGSDISAIG